MSNNTNADEAAYAFNTNFDSYLVDVPQPLALATVDKELLNWISADMMLLIRNFVSSFESIKETIGELRGGVYVKEQTIQAVKYLYETDKRNVLAVMFYIAALTCAKGTTQWNPKVERPTSAKVKFLRMLYNKMKTTNLRAQNLTLCYPATVRNIIMAYGMNDTWIQFRQGGMTWSECVPSMWTVIPEDKKLDYLKFLTIHGCFIKNKKVDTPENRKFAETETEKIKGFMIQTITNNPADSGSFATELKEAMKGMLHLREALDQNPFQQGIPPVSSFMSWATQAVRM